MHVQQHHCMHVQQHHCMHVQQHQTQHVLYNAHIIFVLNRCVCLLTCRTDRRVSTSWCRRNKLQALIAWICCCCCLCLIDWWLIDWWLMTDCFMHWWLTDLTISCADLKNYVDWCSEFKCEARKRTSINEEFVGKHEVQHQGTCAQRALIFMIPILHFYDSDS